MQYNTHTLANGATIVTFSPHGFKFNDGTESSPQQKEFCNFFTLKKEFKVVGEIKGMKLTSTDFVLSTEQLDLLESVSTTADLLLVPFQMLEAYRKNCERYPDHKKIKNIVSFNSTPETARSSPQDKIVDINNWSVIS